MRTVWGKSILNGLLCNEHKNRSDVSRGTFYNHILRNKCSNAWFEKRREEYRILIQKVFEQYHQVLGAEKIRTILMWRGHRVSTKFVADLMREMGLTSVHRVVQTERLIYPADFGTICYIGQLLHGWP